MNEPILIEVGKKYKFKISRRYTSTVGFSESDGSYFICCTGNGTCIINEDIGKSELIFTGTVENIFYGRIILKDVEYL